MYTTGWEYSRGTTFLLLQIFHGKTDSVPSIEKWGKSGFTPYPKLAEKYVVVVVVVEHGKMQQRCQKRPRNPLKISLISRPSRAILKFCEKKTHTINEFPKKNLFFFIYLSPSRVRSLECLKPSLYTVTVDIFLFYLFFMSSS